MTGKLPAYTMTAPQDSGETPVLSVGHGFGLAAELPLGAGPLAPDSTTKLGAYRTIGSGTASPSARGSDAA